MNVLFAALIAAEWIAGSYEPPAELDFEAFFKDAPAPVLRRTFTVGDDVTNATLRLAVAGLCDVSVNGTRLSSTPLSAWTAYDVRVMEDAYDLLPHLKKDAKNEVWLELGNGWYNPLPWKMWKRLNLREHLAIGTPCVKGTVRLVHQDGRVEEFQTGDEWQAADGMMVFNNIYRGETRDFRRKVGDWQTARIVRGPKGKVEPRGDFPPVVVRACVSAKSVQRQGDRWLVDFGENLAGTIRLVLRTVKDGQRIRCRYGESLWSDGTLNPMSAVCGTIKDPDVKPHGVAEQVDECVCCVSDELVFEPRFTFHAFRYLEVSGYEGALSADDVVALPWSADVKTVGFFRCSNERLNKLHEVCLRTFRNNLQSVQSDCPGREKFGYGADIAVTAESFCLNYDMAAFYRKTVRDFLDAAAPDGWFTECAPYNGIHFGFPSGGDSQRSGPIGWAVAVPVVLDALVRYDGDLGIVREAYPALKRYLAHLAAVWPDGLADECLGDWLAVVPPWKTTSGTAHYYQFARLTAKLARQIGESRDSEEYERLAEKIAIAFRKAHVQATGVYWPGCVSAQAFGVYHKRLLTEDQRKASYRTMKEELFALGNFNTAGLFGTQYLLEVLSANGDAELAGKVVFNDKAPGWMRMLDMGATTLWEDWYGTSGSMSMDHPMFGSVEQWFYRHLLGIEISEDAVGCDRVRIDPKPVAGVDWAEGWFDTPRGRIAVSWKRAGVDILKDIKVPDSVRLVP